MSTVNLTETLIHLQDRQPQLFHFVSPDVEQARIAARVRLKFPLNLGDCFAYALAVQEVSPILTLDKDFCALDWEIIHQEQFYCVCHACYDADQ